MIGHITYLSGAALDEKFGRRLQFADDIRYTITEPEFEVESYLRHQADTFVQRFDANTYLYISRALTLLRPRARARRRLARARAGGRARADAADLVQLRLAVPAVRLARRSRRRCARSASRSSCHVIDAPYGHDSFLLEEARQTPIIRRFLEASRMTGEPTARRGARVRLRHAPAPRRPAPRPEHRRARRADLPDDELRLRGRRVARPRTSTCRSTATRTRGS